MSELFEYYFEDDTCHFKYAQGKPSMLGREFHNYNELVLFLDGHSQLISEDIQLTLTPGTLVLIPREQFHQFIVTEAETYQRCILGFREIPELHSLIRQVMEEITVIPQPSNRILSVFQSLMEAAKWALPQEEMMLLIHAALTQLLIEHKLFSDPSIRKLVTVSAITRKALAYIDAHLSEPLELEHIADAQNVSVSTLSHHFKKELNIPIYRYIVKKRLAAARKHMERGLSAHTAASVSGFQDYTGFYKLYKKYYFEPPTGAENFRTKSTKKNQ